MGYNARNDEIRDDVTRMQREWEAQLGACVIRYCRRLAAFTADGFGQKGVCLTFDKLRDLGFQ
jgi:hypothetical protein